MAFVFVLGVIVVIFGFVVSMSRFINCLIMVENLNILLLFNCLLSQGFESRLLFLVLMVVFTVEITLCLVVLTRLWRSSDLVSFIGL